MCTGARVLSYLKENDCCCADSGVPSRENVVKGALLREALGEVEKFLRVSLMIGCTVLLLVGCAGTVRQTSSGIPRARALQETGRPMSKAPLARTPACFWPRRYRPLRPSPISIP